MSLKKWLAALGILASLIITCIFQAALIFDPYLDTAGTLGMSGMLWGVEFVVMIMTVAFVWNYDG